MNKLFFVLGLALAAPPTQAAQVYRCEVNGQSVYQDSPCAGKSESVAVPQRKSGKAKQTSRDEAAARNCLRHKLGAQLPANKELLRLDKVSKGWDTFKGVAASWVEVTASLQLPDNEPMPLGTFRCVLAGDHKTINQYLN